MKREKGIQSMLWSYGVTTVPQRRNNLLPRTLASLRAAGFESPRLFVDGDTASSAGGWESEFRLPVTIRSGGNVRTYGNWILSLWELYLREPNADRYILFQDDLLAVKNLRQYLETYKTYPGTSYYNLLTFPLNHHPQKDSFGRELVGWYKASQYGKGAVALVFDVAKVHTILSSRNIVEKPRDPIRGWRNVDGAVWQSLCGQNGMTELVHFPSLVTHTGTVSSMGNRTYPHMPSFPGEDFDALTLRKGEAFSDRMEKV